MKTEIRRILIVDDSPKDIELIISALSENNLGNEIDVAEDGEEALDYLYKRGAFSHIVKLPAVVLLDIKMPKMNGIEVLRHVRSKSRFKGIPIIMLTSSSEEKDLAECYKLGANSYVVKPVDIIGFMNAIKSVGHYWFVTNQPPPPPARLLKS